MELCNGEVLLNQISLALLKINKGLGRYPHPSNINVKPTTSSNMEMAKYIMRILRSQLMVMWSWGFNNPTAIENGLQFRVQGFKFKGIVEVVYDEGWDLFDVRFIKDGKVIETIEGVYIDGLVQVIDDYVEKTSDYKKKEKKQYSISL